MKTFTIAFVVAVVLHVAARATTVPAPKFAQIDKDYELSWSQNDDKGEFAITLKSTSKSRLCISVDDWPDRSGQISGGGARSSIKADNFSAASVDTNFGFCVGKLCTITIAPYGSISGVIGYKEFGDSSYIKSLHNKQLTYVISPYFCQL